MKSIFPIHRRILDRYRAYIESFIEIADEDIRKAVEKELSDGRLWPEPLVQFNPSYERNTSVDALVKEGVLHPELDAVFKGYELYTHQVQALRQGVEKKSFIVTSGTGSGKSLTYLGTIFHHLFSSGSGSGVKAVLVYPMNALINSQVEELKKFAENYRDFTESDFPLTFAEYTGQTKGDRRKQIIDNPPDILLTNYMMLELMLTRHSEAKLRTSIDQNLEFLVFDELHTYRGRQGADIGMLIRRIKTRVGSDVCCIGTSATMASRGHLKEQSHLIAKVGKSIFGVHFSEPQIIRETLERSVAWTGYLPSEAELKTVISSNAPITPDPDLLRNHPLAIWLEDVIALKKVDDGNDNTTLGRRKPQPLKKTASQLAEASGLDEDQCLTTLEAFLEWVSLVNEKLTEANERYTILPYRLHQFLAQSGSVYATLEKADTRHITLQPGLHHRLKSGDKANALLYPHVFSRLSGKTFICVSFNAGSTNVIPREFGNSGQENDGLHHGYIIPGGAEIWDPSSDIEALPDSWLNYTKTKGITIKKDYRERLPQRVFYDVDGSICGEGNPNGLPLEGWFMLGSPKGLLFDPTAGAFYDGNTNERTKLTTLGNEGRSTSTTITSFLTLDELHQAGVDAKDQKLLSFTDNRQDAALQSGHFNDFIRVAQIRSAIARTLATNPAGLDYKSIGEEVRSTLGLAIVDCSKLDKEPAPFLQDEHNKRFADYLTYLIIHDLRRGWRVVLPNLERCALLEIDYINRVESSEWNEGWKDVPVLCDLAPSERAEFLRDTLDYFRLEYALADRNYLDQHKLRDAAKDFRNNLRDEWAFDGEEAYLPAFLRLDKLHARDRRQSSSLGITSAFGKFTKQFFKAADPDFKLDRSTYDIFIRAYIQFLEKAGYIASTPTKDAGNCDIQIYQLKLDRIVWKPGDRSTVNHDRVKVRAFKKVIAKPNAFFQELYRTDFSKLKRLRGEEHTGQLGHDQRIDREDRFRADWYTDPAKKTVDADRIRREMVSALYCSPTMELGIDISNLSVVHMRNAPPNAANYAQRSGRAGRSGQAALVITYCSSYSPHDRNFFENKEDLVAGSVEEPRLDLINRELIESHIHALALGELPLSVTKSVTEILDPDLVDYPMRPDIKAALSTSLSERKPIVALALRALSSIRTELEAQSWFSEDWVSRVVDKLPKTIDTALDRWRSLYVEAKFSLTKAARDIESGTLKTTSKEYRRAERQMRQANRQIDLLCNKDDHELTEFYVWRFLASEGVLPGYNFTRLPVRIFLANDADGTSGDYISRPRLIALREYGPRNVVYYAGQKYRVEQMITTNVSALVEEARVCKASGFWLGDAYKNFDTCPITKTDLTQGSNREKIAPLVLLTDQKARSTEYITCEEEERRRNGYLTETYFSVFPDELDRIRVAELKSEDDTFLDLSFIPAAQLVQCNRGDRGRTEKGFPLGMETGFWKGKVNPEAEEEILKVQAYTHTTTDALYIQPLTALGLKRSGILTLQYALKRAIERLYQIEPSELGAESLGTADVPNILLYEASEGSLGILTQLVESPDAFPEVLREAMKLLRYDDPNYTEPASYDDLLSYYNQPHHLILDRWLIKDALERMLVCAIESGKKSKSGTSGAPASGAGDKSYKAHYERMLNELDPSSSTEKTFIDYLYANGLKLPDSAQKTVPGIYCQPDFFYEPDVWVFCDGTPHADPKVQADDKKKRRALTSRGDALVVFHYKDSLDSLVADYPDIFKKVVSS